ncbi:MAG: hypothetical protein QOD66_858 [Solirubrobacteraceae bacterium]|jgi:hypothetical protein|nr:hypothetical protein [Solirubrobacteraceae bacterium]
MSRESRRQEEQAAREWKGAYRPYDILREATIALGVVLALVIGLTVLFSSPDSPPSTIKQWAHTDPVDFVTTATTELDGTSGTGGYGPPYNHNGTGQHIGFVRPQKWLGVSHPINTASDFVLTPLRSITGQAALQTALTTYQAAPAKTQTAWSTAYEAALAKASATPAGSISVKPGRYGPLPTMMGSLLTFAQSGGLDGALLTSKQFYQTDYTKPLLFMADGGVLSTRAETEHLLGTQWGMMNETGSYPGQSWLWLYTFWYQIKPFSTSANADILVMGVMGVLSLAFILIPFLPGVRDLPRRVPIYKLIWREHYRRLADGT